MLLGIPVNYCHKKFIIKKSRVDLHKRSCGPKVRLGWSTSSWEVQLIQEPVRYFALGAVRHVQKVTDRRVDGAGPLQSTLFVVAAVAAVNPLELPEADAVWVFEGRVGNQCGGGRRCRRHRNSSWPSINLVGVGFVNHLYVVVGVPLVHVSGGQSSASSAPPPSTPSWSLDPVAAARRSLGAGLRFIDTAVGVVRTRREGLVSPDDLLT